VKPRRIVAGALVVLGGVLMFAAPETETLSGAIILGLGVLLEIVLAGVRLDNHRCVEYEHAAALVVTPHAASLRNAVAPPRVRPGTRRAVVTQCS